MVREGNVFRATLRNSSRAELISGGRAGSGDANSALGERDANLRTARAHTARTFARLPVSWQCAAGERRADTHLAPWLAAVVLLLLLSDLVTRRSLWGHLLPAFIARRARRTRAALAELPGRARSRLARRRERRAAAAGAAGPTPEAAPPEPAPAEEPSAGESVFRRAKRRWRK